MTSKRLLALVFASATLVACSSTDSLLRTHDASAGGGTGTGAGVGTGGTIGGNGGTQGTGPMGTGGGAGKIGTGGTSLGRTGGSGGNAGDAGVADAAKDTPASTDGGSAADAIVECEPGYPVGSVRTHSDGCNLCTCQESGTWLCSVHVCPPTDAAVDGEQCPSGQRWCPGCTPGTGTCDIVCPAMPCPIDAGVAADGASSTCAVATTQTDCEARSDCHAVFTDPGTCGCGAPGCCAHFTRCADGGKADCTEPTPINCTMPSPFCELPYVMSYTGGCYEGCVLDTECGP